MLTNEQLDHAIVHGLRDEPGFRNIVSSHRDALDEIAQLRAALAAAEQWAEKAEAAASRAIQECGQRWLESPAFHTFVDLKHGIVGDILFALQEGEISRGKAAECLAEIAHGATEVRLPQYRGEFAEDETPVEVVDALKAENARLRAVVMDMECWCRPNTDELCERCAALRPGGSEPRG